MKQAEGKSPVSFEAHVGRLPQTGLPVTIEADAAQRAALAGQHDLLSVESFRAELLVKRWRRNGVKVEGRVRADITQACIVTLEPVRAHIDEAVEGLFLPEDSRLGREGFDGGGEIMIDAEGPDAPELFGGDKIDAGDLAEQFFGLAIDPYPRKQGVSLDAEDSGGPGDNELQRQLRSLLGKA